MDPANSARLLAWASRVDGLTYYEILGVHEHAGNDTLTQAFRAFAQVFHPDAHGSHQPVEREALRTVFQQGAEAYRVLSEPGLRARYDMALAGGRRRLDQATISLPPRRPDWNIRLDERCRSAAAKLEARRAQKLHADGDLIRAKAALDRALAHDGGANLDIQRYVQDLELQLNARP